MNFVTLDFETANEKLSSACQLGITVVKNNRVTKKKCWLIRPPEMRFNQFNTYIHGIKKSHVKEAPSFDVLWPKINHYIGEKFIFAHNAMFDMAVLRSCLDYYEIVYPKLEYSCSIMVSRKSWPELDKHGLKSIAKFLGIKFKHHDALEDSYATAQIVRQAAKKTKVSSIRQMLKKFEIQPGSIFPGGYKPIRQLNEFNLKPSRQVKIDPGHPYFNQTFVFTGTLKYMVRNSAMQKVVDSGGICARSVNEYTDFLVMGYQDMKRLKDGLKSSKLKKAEKLITQGSDIEILTEDDFLAVIDGSK